MKKHIIRLNKKYERENGGRSLLLPVNDDSWRYVLDKTEGLDDAGIINFLRKKALGGHAGRTNFDLSLFGTLVEDPLVRYDDLFKLILGDEFDE